jgi:hypothetical protein
LIEISFSPLTQLKHFILFTYTSAYKNQINKK